MRRHRFLSAALILSLLLFTACGRQSEQTGPRQPSTTTINTAKNTTTAQPSGQELLDDISKQMTACEQYTLDTELTAAMQTERHRKEIQLQDFCQVDWAADALYGRGAMMMTTDTAAAEQRSQQEYSWQYYTEKTEQGLTLHWLTDFSGKQQKETLQYPALENLLQEPFLTENEIASVNLQPDQKLKGKDCYVLAVTLSPQALPLLAEQLQRAGITLTEGQEAAAIPVTVTLWADKEEFFLQRLIVDGDELFAQWLTDSGISYIINGQSLAPSLSMTVDFTYE